MSVEEFVIKDGKLKKYTGHGRYHIVIPDGVKIIGDYVFYDRDMVSIRIPDSVISIGNNAFSGCSSLESVKIPDGVTSIGSSAFRGCTNLKSVDLPRTLSRIGKEAFSDCASLASITLPGTLRSIGELAFYRCRALKTIKIPDSVTSIGQCAFWGSEALESVEISENLKSIGAQAFYRCNSLADKAGFIIVNDVLYGYCGGDDHITIPDGIKMISGGAFHSNQKLISVTLPDSVTIIGESAFINCENLVSITIPAKLRFINQKAFQDCKNLKNIVLPKSIKEFDGSALDVVWKYFSELSHKIIMVCSFLNQINDLVVCKEEIAKKVKANKKQIVEYAMQNDEAGIMANLFQLFKKIDLDALDEYIENVGTAQNVKAFLLDYKNLNYTSEMQEKHENDKLDKELGFKQRTYTEWKKIYNFDLAGDELTITGYKGTETDVIIPENIGKYRVVAIGARAFSPHAARLQANGKALRKNINTIVIPGSVKTIGEDAFFDCIKLTDIIVEEDNTEYSSCNGVLFNKTQTTLLLYPIAKKDSDYLVPETVTNIGERAFSWCENLNQVVLPHGVDCIGNEAFVGCVQLKSVIFPDTVRIISDGAFKFCQQLVSAVLPNSVELIGDECFRHCTGLCSMIIPDSVRSIGIRAFYSCVGLSSVKIPESVVHIGAYAFLGCRRINIYAVKGSFAEKYAMCYNINWKNI